LLGTILHIPLHGFFGRILFVYHVESLFSSTADSGEFRQITN